MSIFTGVFTGMAKDAISGVSGMLTANQKSFISHVILYALCFGFAAWALGAVPGHDGLAKNSDLVKLEQSVLNHHSESAEQFAKVQDISELKLEVVALGLSVKESNASQTLERIMVKEERRCRLVMENNDEAARYAARMVKDLSTRYEVATGRVPRYPSCEDLGMIDR